MLKDRNFLVLSTSVNAAGRDAAVRVEPDDGSEARAILALSAERFEPHAIELPDGWEIELDPPLVVRADGVCLGARLVLRHHGIVDARVDLKAPYCRVDA